VALYDLVRPSMLRARTPHDSPAFAATAPVRRSADMTPGLMRARRQAAGPARSWASSASWRRHGHPSRSAWLTIVRLPRYRVRTPAPRAPSVTDARFRFRSMTSSLCKRRTKIAGVWSTVHITMPQSVGFWCHVLLIDRSLGW